MPAGECEGQVLGGVWAMEAGASGPPPGPIFSLGPQSDGRCFCKAHVCSRTCAACKDGFFGLDQANYFGCRSAFLPAGSRGPIRGGQGPEGAGRPGPRAGPSVARMGAWPGREEARAPQAPLPSVPRPADVTNRPGALTPEPGLGRVVQSPRRPPVGGELPSLPIALDAVGRAPGACVEGAGS